MVRLSVRASVAEERRLAPRAPFAGLVTARLDGESVECRGGDLSESGMRLIPPGSRAPFDQPMLLTFALPEVPSHLTVRAELRRFELSDGHAVWAVAFRGVPASIRRMLRTFVHVGHGQVLEYDAETA